MSPIKMCSASETSLYFMSDLFFFHKIIYLGYLDCLKLQFIKKKKKNSGEENYRTGLYLPERLLPEY